MPVESAFAPDLPVFENLGRRAEGRQWLAQLPAVVREFEEKWGLVTGEPYRGGSAAWVAPARRAAGDDAVLRVGWPHREAREEAAGLRFWGGEGAVRLYDAEPERFVLLVERCNPGDRLDTSALPVDDRLDAAARVARRLWGRAAPRSDASTFETVADVCAEWAADVRVRFDEHRPDLDPGLVELGADLLEWLPATATREAVVHGDFNPGNILSARREAWLAVDVKPMVGDPGYDAPPLVEQVDPVVLRGLVAGEEAVVPRYRELCRHFAEAVDLPFDRLVLWGIARHVESALWHVQQGRLHDAATDARFVQTLATLVDL